MNKYHNILELLYHNRDRGFVETKHLFKDKTEAKRITSELRSDGLVSFEPIKSFGPKPISFKLAITRLGIEKHEEYFLNSSITNVNGNFELKEHTIDILKRLKNGESIVSTKSETKEVSDLLSQLYNLGIGNKTKNGLSIPFQNHKYLTKLIELKSWPKFLEWLEKQNTESIITNDFSGSTIGQVNQSSSFSNSPQNINTNAKETTTQKRNFGEKFWELISENKLISGIILIIIGYLIKLIFGIEF
ncbi:MULTISPECIES: hypothetical protein [Cellulophaga]|uniref:Uncharacterized protein n=1 Tax=Cellulophaga geojensis KL-A TaxID=1328323 RepID=A0ABN0RJK8_9FLAO|nr:MULTISPECIES: hypothetical protein [Cellulophaga]EWH08840.1 hypothetical protein KLA_17439 [Cellulophaga geojensis KL-A]SNQ43744.1 hypothetical protein CL8139_370002 [Cellulophaga lytica]